MKTLIHEIGVIDKSDNKHPVRFNKGLNVVTGKSSTGKSALIEIFDYCFGSSENTVPKGIITDSAAIYYVALQVNNQDMVIARRPDVNSKAFFRREEKYNSENIQSEYFEDNYFRSLDDFKKHLRGFFLDIDDVDESLEVKASRKFNRKAPTPTIRSFTSFMLQHQNLVANKHALFYRFDEKEKRDQVIEHTKFFLGLVDQNYILLSQEKERLTGEVNSLQRQQEANKRAAESYKEKVGPVLNQLYAMMGFSEEPISLQQVLRNPQEAKDKFDTIIIPEKINHNSDAITQYYNELKLKRTLKTAELRKLQRQSSSIKKHIEEEIQFVNNVNQIDSPNQVQISTTICPFCHTEKEGLKHSAEKLQQAIVKISSNLAQTPPMKAMFESSLVAVKRDIELCDKEITKLSEQINEIEKNETQLAKQKSVYENILMTKARLFMLLETLNLADDIELDKSLESLNKQLNKINADLSKYDVQKGLDNASEKVNKYMADIGTHFEFEDSYKPIHLHFSFKTFDLYHETQKGEKVYLRSMGSGANWLYSHVTLFLALHKYFAELGESCSIPTVLFFDQPTQVYFPNFKRDTAENFKDTKSTEKNQRTGGERAIDEDIKAVENLFTQLSIYCNSIEVSNGFCPQIIVTDHADDLVLSNGVSFDSLVNKNRWRQRGLIDPVPSGINGGTE